MSRIALITTTIGDAGVLRLYRKFDPSVRMIIAGDQKSPHSKLDALCDDLGNAEYLGPTDQENMAPRLSEITGWQSIQRRNFATLAALRWGADIIITVDDDNYCFDNMYFHAMRTQIEYPHNGLKVSGYGDWFDVGQLLLPSAKHRGFPFEQIAAYQVGYATNAKVGVAAGICLGDPDVDAVTRLNGRFDVHSVSELLRSGIVVAPGTHTVFNSQNTSFIRELAPAMFMLPGVGRYDDILASLVVQRVMYESGLHVHFGQPFVWQSRNPHRLVNDLKAELLGMERVKDFAYWLDSLALKRGTPFFHTIDIFNAMSQLDWMPRQTIDAAQAWCEVVERTL